MLFFLNAIAQPRKKQAKRNQKNISTFSQVLAEFKQDIQGISGKSQADKLRIDKSIDELKSSYEVKFKKLNETSQALEHRLKDTETRGEQSKEAIESLEQAFSDLNQEKEKLLQDFKKAIEIKLTGP